MSTAASAERDAVVAPVARRAAAASAVGSALEWIDFAAYGAVAATVFPKLFFPELDPATGVLASFISFGAGFFARPLGGLLFGALGDRWGRKHVLLYTLSLMGVASFLIGCLPTYASIGVAAPVALLVLRFLQGLALGGEATGAQLMTMEHAPPARRGLFGSFINMGSSISQAFANGLLFVLIALLGQGDFERWGWRVPFLLSVSLVLVGIYIRLRVPETPAFVHAHDEKHARVPLTGAFRDHWRTIVRLLVLWCAPAACFYVINVFTLSYVTQGLGLSSQTAFLSLMTANVVAVAAMLAGGALSDRIGRRPAMLIGASVMLVAAITYFPVLQTRSWPAIFAIMTLFVASLQFQTGVQPAFFAEPFPTAVRYSGSAAAYTGANLFAAAPAPFVCAWLLQRSGGETWSITAMCVAVSLCSILAIWISPETRGIEIDR